MCEAGAVSVNGVKAKSAREVHVGDELTIRGREKTVTVKIAEVPNRPPPKSLAPSLYVLVAENPNPAAGI
jgi:ribosomal 50S subunit-recycling heat shock protein